MVMLLTQLMPSVMIINVHINYRVWICIFKIFV